MFDRSSMLAVRKLPRGINTVDPSGCRALHVSMAVWIAEVHSVELSPTAPCSVIEQTGPVMAGLSPVLALPAVGLATMAPAIAPVAIVTAAMKTQILQSTLAVATTAAATIDTARAMLVQLGQAATIWPTNQAVYRYSICSRGARGSETGSKLLGSLI